jgi:hypothetical protein
LLCRDLALGAARLAILPPPAVLGGCPSNVSAHELADTLLDGTRPTSGFVPDRQGLTPTDGPMRRVLERLLRAA